MPITSLSMWTTPSTVSIFAQAPGVGFAAFLLNLSAVPQSGRARLDLAETEDYTRSYQITRNPVERLVAQNRIRLPDTLVLSGVLSAHPLNSPLPQAGIARLDKRELDKLRTLLDRKEPLFIVTPERMYSNMVCVSGAERYDDAVSLGVSLTLSFEEIQIVSPSLVESVLDLDTLGTGSGTTADLGPQTPTDTADPFTSGGSISLSTAEQSALTAG